jgi:hypothetical protein
MPVKYFLDNGQKFLVSECLEKGLLSNKYPLAYLIECSSDRKWHGTPSVTQCLNGTRMEYLKILCDYAIDPAGQAFRIVGTRAHKKLEKLAPKQSFSEMKINENDITGTADLLEQQPNGEWWLTDYKTSGSYAVAKALGLVKKKRPAVDENGDPVLYVKSGAWGKAGDQKTEDYWEVDPEAVDMKDWVMQLNMYRIISEKYFDIKIGKLKIFIVVRDGGTIQAKNNGVSENIYYIDVPFLDDEEVETFFKYKRVNLVTHLGLYDATENLKESAPEMCSEEECWNGARCKKYCDVAEFCKAIGDNNHLVDDSI